MLLIGCTANLYSLTIYFYSIFIVFSESEFIFVHVSKEKEIVYQVSSHVVSVQAFLGVNRGA